MNKSLLTNIISCLILIIGYFVPFHGNLILITGLFALSGSVTNWLAIHMIFEKIPFLYGSGIIQIHFEEIKSKCGRTLQPRADQFYGMQISRSHPFIEIFEEFIDLPSIPLPP